MFIIIKFAIASSEHRVRDRGAALHVDTRRLMPRGPQLHRTTLTTAQLSRHGNLATPARSGILTVSRVPIHLQRLLHLAPVAERDLGVLEPSDRLRAVGAVERSPLFGRMDLCGLEVSNCVSAGASRSRTSARLQHNIIMTL